jgi:hypothetical protein
VAAGKDRLSAHDHRSLLTLALKRGLQTLAKAIERRVAALENRRLHRADSHLWPIAGWSRLWSAMAFRPRPNRASDLNRGDQNADT